MNGHVGDKRGGFEKVLVKYIHGQKNNEGLDILEFCRTFDLMITNFAKLFTFRSGDSKSQTVFILTRRKHISKIKDCSTFAGKECMSQHKLLRAKLKVEEKMKEKSKGKAELKCGS